jgi:hypothetical protein
MSENHETRGAIPMTKIGDELAKAVMRFEKDNVKFEAGNKSAGVRARKTLMEIKKMAGDARKQLIAANNEVKAAA